MVPRDLLVSLAPDSIGLAPRGRGRACQIAWNRDPHLVKPTRRNTASLINDMRVRAGRVTVGSDFTSCAVRIASAWANYPILPPPRRPEPRLGLGSRGVNLVVQLAGIVSGFFTPRTLT